MANPRRVLARGGGTAARILGHAGLFFWAAIILIPLYLMLLSSVKSNTGIFADPTGLDFSDIQWGNYAGALKGGSGGPSLLVYYGNTLVVSIVSLAIGMSVGTFAGYAIARSQSVWSQWIYRVFVGLLTIPTLVALIPIYNLLGVLGIRGSLAGLSLVYGSFMIPVVVLLSRAYFSGFPQDVIEAAQLDGLGEVGAFFRIVIPMSYRSMAGIFMVNLIGVWSELAFALVLQVQPESKTLPVGLLSFKSQYTTDFGAQFAALVLAILPLFVIYLFLSRRIMDGIAVGGALK